jgi:menaquinone-dependent protoporphyrinogen oxidase
MDSILVAHAETEGTGAIADFIVRALMAQGVEVEVIDVAAKSATLVQPVYAAAIACGSLLGNRGQHALLRFLKDNNSWLSAIPAAFVDICPAAAATDDASREQLRSSADAFYRDAGWTPGITRHVAGALQSAQRPFLVRLVLNHVASRRRDDAQAPRDGEYTDWDDLTRFVQEFLGAVHFQERAREPLLDGQPPSSRGH